MLNFSEVSVGKRIASREWSPGAERRHHRESATGVCEVRGNRCFYTYVFPGSPLNHPGSFMQVIFCLMIFF